MIKTQSFLKVIFMSAAFSLFTLSAGCSNQHDETKSIKQGVTQMLEVANSIKQDIANNDSSKAQLDGPKLEVAWKHFEENVQEKYPDLYEKIENYLDPTIAGATAKTLDKATLTKVNDELIAALKELANHYK